MRKNKIYLILAIITSITLFTTATICNKCQAEEKAIKEDVSQEANIATTELGVVIYECGYLIRNEEVLHKYDFIQYIGDTGQNNPCRGFTGFETNGNNQWDGWTYSAQANGHFIVNHIS